MRDSKGSKLVPFLREGSDSDPHRLLRGSSASPPRHPPPRRRRQDPDPEPIVLSPPHIELCSEAHWQGAIDLLAELLASAFERRPDDSKAA